MYSDIWERVRRSTEDDTFIFKSVLSFKRFNHFCRYSRSQLFNLAAHADLQVEWFAADYKFLQNLKHSVRSQPAAHAGSC